MRLSPLAAPALALLSVYAHEQTAAQAPVQASTQTSAEARLAAQNALFEQSWQTTLKLSPLLATNVGDYRYNDQLGDNSLAAIERRHAIEQEWMARIETISDAGFNDQDALSHVLFLRNLQQRSADYELKEYEMPINSQGGIHTALADLPLSVPFDSIKHYEDYIARLRQIPVAFTQTEEVLRAGVRDHLVPVKFLAAKIPEQCSGIIASDPFLLPLKKFPASFSDADKQRLTAEMTDVVNTVVIPAYRQFATFAEKDYIPYGRSELSIESLPQGKVRYQNDIHRLTTTNLTPAQIHAIGLSEYDRIVREMTALAKQNGYPDLPSFRKAIESDPKYVPHSAQQIVDDFAHYIAQMRPRLPELFTVIPAAPVTVEPIPGFQSAAATHYQSGTPDGRRPGRVSVAVSDFAQRSLINDEAVAYHEGIPGHHMQISVAQTIPGLPEFRKHGGNSAYAEGWALYAEELGKEVGFYQDPGSDYGRLRSELFRAVRLVVDTGIHDMGWSRDQVVEYMRKSGAIDEPTIQSETDRYISWPGQADSYKLGQLKIRELRERARQQLGPHFDIRTFHDEVLNGGNLPLDLLELRINRWIEGQMPANAKN
jgi:uncharacterized protein (DUF885 family)